MGTAANVLVGANGAVYSAPGGTPLPTDSDSGVADPFVDLGFISDDGVVESIGSDSTDIKAMNGSAVRTVQTSHVLTYKFTLLETSDETLKVRYGNAADGAVQITASQGLRGAWVITVLDGDDVVLIAIPDGQVTDRGDRVYKNDSAAAVETTITCYPDEDDVKAYVYNPPTGS